MTSRAAASLHNVWSRTFCRPRSMFVKLGAAEQHEGGQCFLGDVSALPRFPDQPTDHSVESVEIGHLKSPHLGRSPVQQALSLSDRCRMSRMMQTVCLANVSGKERFSSKSTYERLPVNSQTPIRSGHMSCHSTTYGPDQATETYVRRRFPVFKEGGRTYV